MKGRFASWWFAAVLLAGVARAERIRWFCDPGSVNFDSAGVAMDGGFVFELGVFDAGFEPSLANRGVWLDRWNPAQSANYDASSSRFTAELQIFDNAAPFGVGADAWIFGRKSGASGEEWILFRSSGWEWPAVNPFNPEPLQWNAADAAVVAAGEVDGDGGPFLMKATRVIDYAAWRDTLLAGESLDGPEEDADSDGVTNAVEYFCGTDPLDGAWRPREAVSVEGGGLRVAYPVWGEALAVVAVEASEDLLGWGDQGVTLQRMGEEWIATTASGTGRGFLRLRVEVP